MTINRELKCCGYVKIDKYFNIDSCSEGGHGGGEGDNV